MTGACALRLSIGYPCADHVENSSRIPRFPISINSGEYMSSLYQECPIEKKYRHTHPTHVMFFHQSRQTFMDTYRCIDTSIHRYAPTYMHCIYCIYNVSIVIYDNIFFTHIFDMYIYLSCIDTYSDIHKHIGFEIPLCVCVIAH